MGNYTFYMSVNLSMFLIPKETWQKIHPWCMTSEGKFRVNTELLKDLGDQLSFCCEHFHRTRVYNPICIMIILTLPIYKKQAEIGIPHPPMNA